MNRNVRLNLLRHAVKQVCMNWEHYQFIKAPIPRDSCKKHDTPYRYECYECLEEQRDKQAYLRALDQQDESDGSPTGLPCNWCHKDPCACRSSTS